VRARVALTDERDGVSSVASMFEKAAAETEANEAINPLSSSYVGPEEHRRRIEERHGELKKYGSPKQEALDRALPGQLATAFNTLRFVDAINALVGSGELGEEWRALDAAPFEALMGWRDGALQQRFSSAAQYLRSGKKFGLLHFEGEYPMGEVRIQSRSMGYTRDQLWQSAIRQPQLIVPRMTGPDDAEKLRTTMEQLSDATEQLNSFLMGAFDGEMSDIVEWEHLTAALKPPLRTAPYPLPAAASAEKGTSRSARRRAKTVRMRASSSGGGSGGGDGGEGGEGGVEGGGEAAGSSLRAPKKSGGATKRMVSSREHGAHKSGRKTVRNRGKKGCGWVTLVKDGMVLVKVRQAFLDHQGRLDAGQRQAHLEQWQRRLRADKALAATTNLRGARQRKEGIGSSSGTPANIFTQELAIDPFEIGFAYGGVDPGTLHARGLLHEVHRCTVPVR
jgi:hypothetical protein